MHNSEASKLMRYPPVSRGNMGRNTKPAAGIFAEMPLMPRSFCLLVGIILFAHVISAQDRTAALSPVASSEQKNIRVGQSGDFFSGAVKIAVKSIMPEGDSPTARATFAATTAAGQTGQYKSQEIGSQVTVGGFQIYLSAIDLTNLDEAAFKVTQNPSRIGEALPPPSSPRDGVQLATWIFGILFALYLMGIAAYL